VFVSMLNFVINLFHYYDENFLLTSATGSSSFRICQVTVTAWNYLQKKIKQDVAYMH